MPCGTKVMRLGLQTLLLHILFCSSNTVIPASKTFGFNFVLKPSFVLT